MKSPGDIFAKGVEAIYDFLSKKAGHRVACVFGICTFPLLLIFMFFESLTGANWFEDDDGLPMSFGTMGTAYGRAFEELIKGK